MGIEPTQSAWKAEVLPLNYTRLLFCNSFQDDRTTCAQIPTFMRIYTHPAEQTLFLYHLVAYITRSIH